MLPVRLECPAAPAPIRAAGATTACARGSGRRATRTSDSGSSKRAQSACNSCPRSPLASARASTRSTAAGRQPPLRGQSARDRAKSAAHERAIRIQRVVEVEHDGAAVTQCVALPRASIARMCSAARRAPNPSTSWRARDAVMPPAPFVAKQPRHAARPHVRSPCPTRCRRRRRRRARQTPRIARRCAGTTARATAGVPSAHASYSVTPPATIATSQSTSACVSPVRADSQRAPRSVGRRPRENPAATDNRHVAACIAESRARVAARRDERGDRRQARRARAWPAFVRVHRFAERDPDAAIEQIETAAPFSTVAGCANLAGADAAADHEIRVVRRHTVVDADRRHAGAARAGDPGASVLQARVVDHEQIGAIERGRDRRSSEVPSTWRRGRPPCRRGPTARPASRDAAPARAPHQSARSQTRAGGHAHHDSQSESTAPERAEGRSSYALAITPSTPGGQSTTRRPASASAPHRERRPRPATPGAPDAR